MFDERSYGVIPLRQSNGQWEVLLVQLHAGHWGFPKGHGEEGEAPKAAARRELLEETSLTFTDFLSDTFFTESYTFERNHRHTTKQVLYYLALVSGDPIIQKEELNDAQWLTLPAAAACITFSESQKTLAKVQQFLQTMA